MTTEAPERKDPVHPAAGRPTGETLFTVRGLTRRYGEVSVLEDLSFDILRGECLVILGRSGSGKSVTLRQLNGLESPDGGEVTFDGQPVSSLTERELQFVRAHYGFDSGQKVTLDVIGQQAGLTRERVRQVIVGALDKLRDDPVIQAYGASLVDG